MHRLLLTLLCLFSLLLVTQASYGRGRGDRHRHPHRHRGGYGYGVRGRCYGRPRNVRYGGNVRYHGGGYGGPPPPQPPCNAPCYPSYGLPGEEGCICPVTQAPPTTSVTQDLSTTTYITPTTMLTTRTLSTTTAYSASTGTQVFTTTTRSTLTSTPTTHEPTTTPTTEASTTTPTAQKTTTTTYCHWNVTMHCNEVGLNVQKNTGAFMNCSTVLSNDTMNAWNAQCLSRLCNYDVSTDGYRLNQTAKCIIYEEFAAICNAALPEGNRLYDQTGVPGKDYWRRRYNCSAPPTTPAPPTTTSPLVPPTTTACSAFKRANCGYMRTAQQAQGYWGSCSAIGNATLDAMYQDCLTRLCSVDQNNNTAKCIIYEEFATACVNAGAGLGDWRSTYQCPAPETTVAPALAAQQLIQNPAVRSQIAEGAPVAVADGTAADGINGGAAVGGSDASAGGDSGDGVQWFDWKVQKASIQRGLAQIKQLLAKPQ